MKTFLVNNKKKPLCKWSYLPDNVYFKGSIPKGYSLGVCPSKGYIVVDVDRHGDKDGFKVIPKDIQNELNITFNYTTKNNGIHYWFKYTGKKVLANKSSGLGIDLRVSASKNSAGGYVVFYPADKRINIEDCIEQINPTSSKLNKWLEKLFSYKNKK